MGVIGSKGPQFVVAGLASAGKSTVAEKLHAGFAGGRSRSSGQKPPRIVETATARGCSTRWVALIFVVDATTAVADLDRARQLLVDLLLPVARRKVAVLVLATKCDLPNCLSEAAIVQHLSLKSLHQPWHLQPCNAVSGGGLSEGLSWLNRHL